MAVRLPSFNASHGPTGLGIREMAREEAIRRQREAGKENAGPRTFFEWCMRVPERGKPLDIEQFPFQVEWMTEEVANAREACWRKASQVGMSGIAWRWGGSRAEAHGERVIYFFPTDDDVTEFGRQRIDQSIADSEWLRSRILPGATNNVHLKELGSGDVSLRGTQSKVAVQSVDADALVFDEYDLLNPANLAQAERRVAGAQAAGRTPRIRRFGNPSISGYGIDALYSRSDQRVWHVTCPECGTEQPLAWDENARWRSDWDAEVCRSSADDFMDPGDVVEAWRACRDCEASLEPGGGSWKITESGDVFLDADVTVGPIHEGRWVSTNPDGRTIGYHVSRLIVPRTDLLELVRNSRKTAPHEQEAFYNNDLGEPYSPTEAALTDADISAAMSDQDSIEMVYSYRARQPILMGVDVASERNLSAWIDELLNDGRTRTLYVGEPEDFEEVMRLIRDYRVSMAVIDSMPERRKARDVQLEFPGRVFLAEYDDRNESDAFIFDPKKAKVRINRTEAFDAMMDSIRHLRRLLPSKEPRRLRAQLKAPKRRTIEEPKKKPKRVYVSTGTEGDDLAHAAVYALVAKEMWALRQQVEEAQAAAGANRPVQPQPLRQRPIADYDPGFGGVG